MKALNFSILIVIVATLFVSCKKVELNDGSKSLVTPTFLLTQQDNPYTGILSVYPCQSNSSIYFGNYNNGKISPLSANYIVSQGAITSSAPELTLPLGEYNLIYWGVSKAVTEAYDNPAVAEPPFSLGVDTKTLYYTLRPSVSDTTYSPTYDYVFNRRATQIGDQTISVPLNRAVAAIDVQVVRDNNTALDESIDKMDILVSDLAYRLNVYDASASDFTKTVKFPLTISGTRKAASNKTVTVFPSVGKPHVVIVATLKNGTEKIYRTTLKTVLSAGTYVKVTVSMGEILTEESSAGGFTVTGWREESETITANSI